MQQLSYDGTYPRPQTSLFQYQFWGHCKTLMQETTESKSWSLAFHWTLHKQLVHKFQQPIHIGDLTHKYVQKKFALLRYRGWLNTELRLLSIPYLGQKGSVPIMKTPCEGTPQGGTNTVIQLLWLCAKTSILNCLTKNIEKFDTMVPENLLYSCGLGGLSWCGDTHTYRKSAWEQGMRGIGLFCCIYIEQCMLAGCSLNIFLWGRICILYLLRDHWAFFEAVFVFYSWCMFIEHCI